MAAKGWWVSSLEVNTDTLHRSQETENKTQHKMLNEFLDYQLKIWKELFLFYYLRLNDSEVHFEQYNKSIKLNGAFQVTVLDNAVTELSPEFENDWLNL